MNLKRILIISILAVLFSNNLSAAIVKGKIVSKDEKNGISGVSIYFQKNLKSGTTSNLEGKFELITDNLPETLIISALGYNKKLVRLQYTQNTIIDLEQIELTAKTIDLREIRIFSSFADERKTPVSVSSIKADQLDKKLGDQTFPESMKNIPGVYATRTGGGSGDARISIRGFKQENVALLLNGVPISSVENGLVYWNNWIGLSEATQMIQVQKGLGASKVALNSLGGTINIITKSTQTEKGGSFQHSLTSYGNKKTTFSFSTGLLDNKWAITFLGSRTSGDGYVDATYVDAWAYFLSAGRQFGTNHKLVVTLLGAPEKHGQRNFELSQQEINKYGIKFNKDWGNMYGNVNNASENFYHKPQLSINHYWNINKKLFLASSAYISIGNGGGKWSESFNYGPSIFQLRKPNQQIDWEAAFAFNQHNDTYTLANGDHLSGFSRIIQTDYIASHLWTGALSTIEYKINNHFKLISGFHYRYFKSKLQEKVRDLLGGDFWIDDYAWAIEGYGNRPQIKKVGDVTKVDNGAEINFFHLFSQLEYDKGPVHTFLAVSASNTWFQREDRYNYLVNTYSETVQKSGYNLKTGINYNLNNTQNIYFNTGYYSKAPLFKFVFPNYNNSPALGINNETVLAAEIGYAYRSKTFSFKVNAYYTKWKDISFLSKEYIQLQDNSQTRALVNGLDALHKGVEIEIEKQINSKLRLGAYASLGNWEWQNDVHATLFNDNNVEVGKTDVFAKGLKVGDAPQTQLGGFVKSRILNSFDLEVNWNYSANLYADFDPVSRNDVNDRQQSLKLPSYHLFDLYLGYDFKLMSNQAYVGLNCYNVFNQTHILRGIDGPDHTLNSFKGFWGFGRNFNLSLKVNF